MAQLRRLHVTTLENLKAGDSIPLPDSEAHHARVLRLESGGEVLLIDGAGRSASAELETGARGALRAILRKITETALGENGAKIFLAVPWPKGKRAAMLVEKCTELGVSRILPVRFARGVVHKDDDSAGLSRLRRIAAEAAKQCGRLDLPEICAEESFTELIHNPPEGAQIFVLDPRGEEELLQVLLANKVSRLLPILLIVGPEGGLIEEEVEAALRTGARRVKLARHVLRIETAALAACAIAQSAARLPQGSAGEE